MQKSFRSTLWFKKGELDTAAAESAADGKDGLHPGAVDLLPVEDRYLDDGSLTHDDRRQFSLQTGHTQVVPKLHVVSLPNAVETLEPLLRDLKRGRRAKLAFIAASMAGIGTMLAINFM